MGRLIISLVIVVVLSSSTLSQVYFIESSEQLNMSEQDFSSGIAIVDFNNDFVNEVFTVNCFNTNRFYVRDESIYSDLAETYALSFTDNYHDI